MHCRSGYPTSVLQESATNYNIANYSLSQIYKRNGSACSSDYREQIQEQQQPGQEEHGKLIKETTKRERYLTFAAPPKSLHCVRRDAHSLAVHLEVGVATPQ